MCLENISYEGHDLWVKFDYQPEEPMVRYYSDGSGYPGCAEEYNIYSVKLGSHEMIGHLSKEQLAGIEQALIYARDNYNDY
jgi:hypothetical protein